MLSSSNTTTNTEEIFSLYTLSLQMSIQSLLPSLRWYQQDFHFWDSEKCHHSPEYTFPDLFLTRKTNKNQTMSDSDTEESKPAQTESMADLAT